MTPCTPFDSRINIIPSTRHHTSSLALRQLLRLNLATGLAGREHHPRVVILSLMTRMMTAQMSFLQINDSTLSLTTYKAPSDQCQGLKIVMRCRGQTCKIRRCHSQKTQRCKSGDLTTSWSPSSARRMENPITSPPRSWTADFIQTAPTFFSSRGGLSAAHCQKTW